MNMFIIGSGFTKAVLPSAPVNSELLDRLASTGTETAAAKLCDQYETKDIEIALTRLDLDIAAIEASSSGSCTYTEKSTTELKELRERAVLEIAKFFGFSNKHGEPATNSFAPTEKHRKNRWLKSFLDCIKTDDILVSLNYDCVLEGLLDLTDKWTPNHGHGEQSLNFLVAAKVDSTKSPTTVLKIHGSASFGKNRVIGDPDVKPIGLNIEPRFFPRSAASKHYTGGGSECAIVPPSFAKIPSFELAHIMLEALDATRGAQNLVIIGCALRPEDSFLTLLHTSFFEHHPNGKIIVVDPNASSIKARLLSYWGRDYENQIHSIEKCLQEGVADLVKHMFPKR